MQTKPSVDGKYQPGAIALVRNLYRRKRGKRKTAELEYNPEHVILDRMSTNRASWYVRYKCTLLNSFKIPSSSILFAWNISEFYIILRKDLEKLKYLSLFI